VAADIDAILIRYRKPVIDAMRAALARPGIEHIALMRYHLGWEDGAGNAIDDAGGKMLRPAFCLLACEAVGGRVERALPAAAAIELLHNFTLIHDDIEDASDTRHGRETLWRRVGIPLAINAGDGLFVLARRTLLDLRAGVAPERVLEAARVLDEACVLLCEGQHADISFESRHRVSLAEYEVMIEGKTAVLLGAAAHVGALAGGADDATAKALDDCARMLGMAFQVQDDVLGVWGDSALTGKPVADDIRTRKKSFPVVWAFEHAPQAARERLDRLCNGEMVEADVSEAVSLLEEAGARQAAVDVAELWVEDALGQLEGLDLVEERRRDIEALAAFFVARST
jgi:geranylgeranyl diphosphate synthase type I